MVKLDRCIGNCNVINNLSNEGCVPCKTGDLNLSVFNIITGINESKKSTKHLSCERKCKWTQINGEITINVDVSVKNIIYVKKIMFRIFLHVIVKMENI